MKPFVIRPICEEDYQGLVDLAYSTKGMTSLPQDKDLLKNKIYDSLKAFNPYVRKPGGESYLFVLEDLEKQKIIGTCGIVSKVGGFDPFYTYQIKSEPLKCETLNVDKEIQVLHLHINHNGPTEIGGLLLHPDYRKHGLGRLLSLSRFLFLAEFPERFDKTVIAEMRGVVEADGTSPFWECVGRHFFNTSFYEADDLTAQGHKEVIANLMPKHPIYLKLLPREAQLVIGEVHSETQPARLLLEKEGFHFNNEVDIFDAGPTLSTSLKEIRTVKESQKAKIKNFTKSLRQSTSYMISNSNLNFKVLIGDIKKVSENEVEISEEIAQALDVNPGDEIRFVSLKKDEIPSTK